MRESMKTKSKQTIISVIAFSCSLISGSASSIDVKNRGGNAIVRPFGIQSTQPPARVNVVTIDKVEFGARADQVCGYTDWTSLQIELPKKLLSKSYWNKLGQNVVNQAKKTVLDLSYALPSMLACNISPTYCHVYNQSELMASFEGQLSFETCKILDEVANTDLIQHESLIQCIKSKRAEKKMTDSEAREECLSGGGDIPSSADEQADRISKNTSTIDPKFTVAKFLSDLFPEKTQSQQTIDGTTYSRSNYSAKLLKTYLRGIEVKGSVMVRHGGTYQKILRDELVKKDEQTKNAILNILKEMKKLQEEGLNAQDVISKSSKIWSNKDAWKKNGEPHPIYRSPYDGSEPSFIIRPEQIYQLLPLTDGGVAGNKFLEQVVERMAQTSSYLKIQDHLFDIQTRAIEECFGEKNRSAIAQKNCKMIIEKTKLSMQFLEHKMLSEQRVIESQEKISDLIEAARFSQAMKQERKKVYKETNPLSPITIGKGN